MNLLDKLISYIHLRKLGVRNAWIKSPLLAIDYVLILFSVCLVLIALTLYYADFIDNAFSEQKERVKQAQTATSEANNRMEEYENLVISFLNGRVKLEGVTRTVCLMRADGSCL